VAALSRTHREAWALESVGVAGQFSSLWSPQASPEGLVNGVIYPGSKLGCILIYVSALQVCVIGNEVVTTALAMSGVPAYGEPLMNCCGSLKLVSVTPGGQRHGPCLPKQESTGCLTSK